MIIPLAQRLDGIEEYYFSRKLQEIRTMQATGVRVINLGIGNPDMAPSEGTVARLGESARVPGNHGYQPYKGIVELRQAISSYYRNSYNVELAPETDILPLLGSKEGVLYTSLAFVNPGDDVLIPDPGYPTYASVSRLIGANVRTYTLTEENQWLPDLAALEKSGLERVKVMWVNYPHMPTGVNPPLSLLQRIVDFAQANHILIAFDNPYSHIIHDGDPRSILVCEGGKDVAIELNSLSKSHNMAGWRIGWAAGERKYVDAILRVATNVESGMFLPLQHAAVEALRNSPSWYAEQREEYRLRRVLGEEIMHALGCRFHKGQVGMFVWARIPEGQANAERFVEEILHTHHLFLAPGHIFGSEGERFVRLSLCSPQEVLRQARARVSAPTLVSDATGGTQ